jgi:hypothetical protein
MPRRRKTRTSKPATRVADRSEPAAQEPAAGSADSPRPTQATTGQFRGLTAQTCGWCGGPIAVKDRGRIPKWCSASCRQRAWEQSRAAASGLSAVQLVERPVKVPMPIEPTRRDWPRLLHELARQLDDGRIYERDLDHLAVAIDVVVGAYGRRPWVRAFPRLAPPRRARWPSQG